MSFDPALWGAITGTAGLSVALLVYCRDAPRVVVTLQWDMTASNPHLGPGPFVVVAVGNVGRRAIFLSHAHIQRPFRGQGAWLFADGIAGVTLAEGAAGHVVRATQAEAAERFAEDWWRARAVVVDIAGRAYRSRWLLERPSFGVGEPPPGAVAMARFLNFLDTCRLRLLA
jgi:hypothetical protein